MKKVLSFALLASSLLMYSQEQIAVNQNFESFTLGNIGTDFTGNTAGQNGWYVYGGTGTTAADFQIVNVTTSQGKSAQLTSGNGYSATNNPNSRFLFYDTSATVATAANNILYVSSKIYTGPATGAGRSQVVTYDATAGVAGIFFDYATKTFKGLGKLTATATSTPGFYSFNLGTQVFSPNTWVSVVFSYNKTTGAYTWEYTDGTTANTGSYGLATAPTGYAMVTGLVPVEIDLINLTLTGNTVANVTAFDDVLMKYSNAALLNVKDVTNANLNDAEISIYPNPVSDVLNIKSKGKVKSVVIYDLSGRKVNAELVNNSINVSSLQSGTYVIDIETSLGKSSQKFIKK